MADFNSVVTKRMSCYPFLLLIESGNGPITFLKGLFTRHVFTSQYIKPAKSSIPTDHQPPVLKLLFIKS